MSRTRRQPYRKSRAFDASCRCRGACSYCLGNRMHRHQKPLLDAAQQLRDIDPVANFRAPARVGAHCGGR